MENFNIVPDKGTFGGSVEVVNQNFLLAQQEMEVLQNKCDNESARAIEAENSIRQLYNNLQQSQPIPVTQLPATGEAGKIYRLAGTNSYADYMWNGSDFILMATYDNAFDDEPIKGSNNIVKSNGVFLVKELALTNKANMSEISESLPISSTTDNAFLLNGVVRSNSSFEVRMYAVQEDSVYLFSGTKGTDVYGFSYICWFDQNDNYIGSSIPTLQGDTTILQDVVVVPPNNAVKAGISVQKSKSSYYDFKKSTNVILSRDLKDSIVKMMNKSPLTETQVRDGIIVNGNFVANSSYRTLDYNVVGGKTYFILSEDMPETSGFYKVSWFDNAGTYIKGDLYLATTSDYKVFLQEPIKAPENAVKVCVCCYVGYLYETRLEESTEIKGYYLSSKGYLPSCALSDVTESGMWMLIDRYTYTDTPNNNLAGFLRVYVFNAWVLQEFVEFSTKKLFRRRFRLDKSLMTDWVESSGGNTYNVNNTFNNIQQTVNLTATPSITADTNNYLASTNDTTDRTADILSLLQSNGICRLGPGVFWVDSLVMPDNTSIIGSGTATKVYLKDGNDKFAIKMGKYCVFKDITLYGSTSAISVTETVGTRHGILWSGNYTAQQDGSLQPMYGTVSDVYISRFNGGGITCYDTGYGTRNYISATNVHIENCGAGINISYWSEFHKFTNVRCYGCYYGCINNGGNNMFVNCDFSSCNGIAFLMDNSQGQSPNNSHGSVIGCVFNHTANNTGVGIKILNCNNGYVFDGCQIFFSKIQIEDSAGIEVVSTNFGQSNCDIIIKNGGVILFANNLHQDTPPSISITNNNKVHFVNCYNRTTGNLISA